MLRVGGVLFLQGLRSRGGPWAFFALLEEVSAHPEEIRARQRSETAEPQASAPLDLWVS